MLPHFDYDETEVQRDEMSGLIFVTGTVHTDVELGVFYAYIPCGIKLKG